MGKPNTIKIDDQEYVRADAVNIMPTKKQIFILQRGWIVVGDGAREGEDFLISNAAVIRVWGTSKGLGEIAEHGPTTNTKLDPCPPMMVHHLAIVARMNVNESKWHD